MEEVNNGYKILKMLKQIMSMIKQRVEYQYKDFDLTGPQGMLIGILTHYGEMKISDLSEKIGLSNSTVSGIIDRLEKQQLVERVRSTEDRRVVYVRVTSKFEKMFQQYFKDIEKRFEESINKATPEELDKIFEGLNTLKNVLERRKD
ncbi:MarR family winged helix-turn-helix transcriptional regulator [Caldicellulosiruptoraceae bacterium PP1]